MASIVNPDPFTTRPEIEGTFGVVATTHWIAIGWNAVPCASVSTVVLDGGGIWPPGANVVGMSAAFSCCCAERTLYQARRTSSATV